jgi:hypothetical protein
MACASLSSVSPSSVPDDGGELLTITGTFDITVSYAVSIVVGTEEIPCYSGASGSGTLSTPISVTQLQAVAPPLPRGGPYAIRVRDENGAIAGGDLANALTSRNRNFHMSIPGIRQLMPRSLATGPRNLSVTDALAMADTADTNTPATFDAIPDLNVGRNATLSYTPTGYTDADGPGPVTWFGINLPSWASVNPSTGEITGTTPADPAVLTGLCIGVNDGQLVTASNEFTITIDAVPAFAELMTLSGTAEGQVQILGETLSQSTGGKYGYACRLNVDGTLTWLADVRSTDMPIIASGAPCIDRSNGDVFAMFMVGPITSAMTTRQVAVYNADGTLYTTLGGIAAATGTCRHTALVLVKYNADGSVQNAMVWANIPTPTTANAEIDYIHCEGMVFDPGSASLYVGTSFSQIGWNSPISADVIFGGNLTYDRTGVSSNPDDNAIRAYQRPRVWVTDPTTLQVYSRVGVDIAYATLSTSVQNYGPANFADTPPNPLAALRSADVPAPTETLYTIDCITRPLSAASWHWSTAPPVTISWYARPRTTNSARWLIQKLNGVELCLSASPPSATDPATDAVNTSADQTAVRFIGDGREFIALGSVGNLTATYRHKFFKGTNTGGVGWTAGWLTDSTQAISPSDGTFGLVMGRFTYDGGATDDITQSWMRFVPTGTNLNPYFRGLLVDETNNAIYLTFRAGFTGSGTQPVSTRWDGSSYSDQDFRGRDKPGILIKFNLTTGAPIWLVPFEGINNGNQRFEPLHVSQDDDYLYVIGTARHQSATPNNLLVMHSDLFNYQPALRFTCGNGINRRRDWMVKITKDSGYVVDATPLSDLRDPTVSASTGYVSTYSHLPATRTGMGAGISHDSDAFDAEAFHTDASTVYTKATGQSVANDWGNGLANLADSTKFGYRNNLGTIGGVVAKQWHDSGGPGGRTNIDDVRVAWADNSTSGYVDWPSFSSPVTQNTRLLVTFRVPNLTYQRYLMDQVAATANRWLLRLNTDGSITFDAGSAVSSPASTYTTNTWYWLLADINGASSTFELSTGATWSGDVGSNTFDRLRLGDTVGAGGLCNRGGDFNFLGFTKMSFAQAKAYAQARWPSL